MVHSDRTRGNGTQEVPSEHQQTLVYGEREEPWHELPREAVGGVFLGDLQKLPGCGAGYPAVGVPAGAGSSRGPCWPQPACESLNLC